MAEIPVKVVEAVAVLVSIVPRWASAKRAVASVEAPVGKAELETTTAPVLHAVTLESRDVVSPAIVVSEALPAVCNVLVALVVSLLLEIATAPVLHAVTLESKDVVSPAIVAREELAVD